MSDDEQQKPPPTPPLPEPSAVDAFLAESVTPAPEVFTSTAEIMASAREWCDEREEHRFGSRALAKALRERGVTKHSNGQKRGWRGVKLR